MKVVKKEIMELITFLKSLRKDGNFDGSIQGFVEKWFSEDSNFQRMLEYTIWRDPSLNFKQRLQYEILHQCIRELDNKVLGNFF